MPLISFSADACLKAAIEKRKNQDSLRRLPSLNLPVDFCSNDYLGFARSKALKAAARKIVIDDSVKINGSTGSRLLTGNSAFAEELETFIARYHHAEAGLIYNSGYDANVGFFSCVPQKEDTVIYDEYIHASVHDGIGLSQARSFMFRHNDLMHLEQRLKISGGVAYVIVESVYSMDGDFAPLKEIAVLCEKYNAHLVVDEAHATGIFGKEGRGLVNELNLEKAIFARIHTFGKALGTHGAIVLGSILLKQYLINFSRSFIYTTALPLHSLQLIQAAYQILPEMTGQVNKLKQLISMFKTKLSSHYEDFIFSESQIQCIVIPGNERVKHLAESIQNEGYDVRPVLSPTVPKGKERIRICIHSFNTIAQITGLVDILVKAKSDHLC